jgi:hypothetical protein
MVTITELHILETSFNLIHILSSKQADILVSLCTRYVPHITVMKGRQSKATHEKIQGNYE